MDQDVEQLPRFRLEPERLGFLARDGLVCIRHGASSLKLIAGFVVILYRTSQSKTRGLLEKCQQCPALSGAVGVVDARIVKPAFLETRASTAGFASLSLRSARGSGRLTLFLFSTNIFHTQIAYNLNTQINY
jgi:hypothetical protein